MSKEPLRQYKGIARNILQGCANTYHKPCSCSIDFLIEFVFNPHKLPYVSNTCKHCKKLRILIKRVLQHAEDEEELEEEDNGELMLHIPASHVNFQTTMTLDTPLQRMITYAKELGAHYFLFLDQSLEEEI